MDTDSRTHTGTTEQRQRRRHRAAFALLAFAVPLLLMGGRMGADLWNDEGHTILSFVSLGFPRVATVYNDPNNHVLFSILLVPFRRISDNEAWLRVVPLVISLGTLAAVHRIARNRLSPRLASPAVLVLGINHMFILYGIGLRGYSLSMCLGAALFGFAVRRRIALSLSRRVLLAICAAAFVYTIPSNAVIALAFALVATARAWGRGHSARQTSKEALTWGAGALLALALYAPILASVFEALGNARETGWKLDAYAIVLGDFIRDVRFLLPMLALGAWDAMRRPRAHGVRVVAFGALAAVLLAFAFHQSLRAYAYVRTFSALLPALALAETALAAQGLRCLARQAGKHRLAQRFLAPALVALVLLIALPDILPYRHRVIEYRSTRPRTKSDYYAYYAADFNPSLAAARIAAAIQPGQNYIFAADKPGINIIPYYLRVNHGYPRQRILPSPDGNPQEAVCYLALSNFNNTNELAAYSGLAPCDLARATLLADCGFFRIFTVRVEVYHDTASGL